MEYFKLDDLAPLTDLNGRKAKFVYRNFKGFDHKLTDAMRTIENELEIRNFNVPGFELKFYLDVKTAEINLSDMANEDMGFRSVGGWELCIPEKKMDLFDDRSGSLDVYCGNEWNEDAKEFRDGRDFHRKMDGLKRIMLHYELRGGTFVATDDLGRGHYPEGNEKLKYSLHEIETEFTAFMNTVIAKIRETPLPESIVDVFQEPASEPVTNPLLEGIVLYGFSERCSNEDAMTKGLVPNHRLLNLGCKLPEHPLAGQMHDGFVYMEMVPEGSALPERPDATDHFNYNCDQRGVIGVNLGKANNVFVLDAGVFDRLKWAWVKENPEAKYLTDELVDDFMRQQAATLVHVNEYRGGYEKPIVLTNRRVWPSELVPVTVKNK